MIYLDNASTTKPDENVLEVYNLIAKTCWANPSNNYKICEEPKRILEESKTKIAKSIGCDPDEIFFTSGASEGNAWGCYVGYRTLCSPWEHHNYMDNDSATVIDEDYLYRCAIDENSYNQQEYTNVLSQCCYAHQLVNNITGEIFDVNQNFNIAHKYGMFCICDMTQAIGNIEINVRDIDCDMAVFSSHKINGLKGTGFVYIRKDMQSKIDPLISGTQQGGKRGGTMNVAEYASTAEAVERAVANLEKKNENGRALKAECVKKLDGYGINWIPVSGNNSIDNTFSFCIKEIESEVIQQMLNEQEIYIGIGSGCSDGSMEREPALVQLEIPDEYVGGLVRLSFSKENTIEEIDRVIQSISETIDKLTRV